jgi:hypothetical protein
MGHGQQEAPKTKRRAREVALVKPLCGPCLLLKDPRDTRSRSLAIKVKLKAKGQFSCGSIYFWDYQVLNGLNALDGQQMAFPM